MQQTLYRAYNRLCETVGARNMVAAMGVLRPLSNHPGGLWANKLKEDAKVEKKGEPESEAS